MNSKFGEKTYLKYEGQSNENRTPAPKWQWNLFHSKVIARSVNTFIPLGDETINSSLVERAGSLIDQTPRPLLQFLVQMKPTSTNVFLEIAKNVKVSRGKIWAVRRMLKCFPTKSLQLIPHQIDSMGTGVIMQKDNYIRQHSRVFWLYSVSQHHQPPRNEQNSLLSVACLHFQCWTNTLYITLTCRAIKKQLCGLVGFHYACLVPYRWQYRYVTTVLPAFARNVFYGGCSVFIWLPIIDHVHSSAWPKWMVNCLLKIFFCFRFLLNEPRCVCVCVCVPWAARQVN